MDKAPYIIGSPEQWRVFAESNRVFMETLPKLRSAIDATVGRSATDQLPIDRAIMTLGWICGNTFHEILILCGNGLGIGGLRLLRVLYEHAVIMQYLCAFPEEVQRFFDYNNIHFGKLFTHVAKQFNLNNRISPDRSEELVRAQKDAESRFQVPLCQTCGTTRGAMSWADGGLLSLAQQARKKLGLKQSEGLDEMYGLCNFIPTLHVHATFFAFKDWVEFSNEGMEWKPDAEEAMVGYAMSSAHLVLLHVLKTHNDYYKLGLDDELQARFEDYKACWGSSTG
jgi:hypothetical protein